MTRRVEKAVWVSVTHQEFDTELDALLCDVKFAFCPYSTEIPRLMSFDPDPVAAVEVLLAYAKRVRHKEAAVPGSENDALIDGVVAGFKEWR